MADAVLDGVSITINTHDDDKDDDTVLNISVQNHKTIFQIQDLASGKNLVGRLDDLSTVTLRLNLASSNIKLEDIVVPVVDIDIEPNGNDRWTFDYTVKLHFNDGTEFSSSKHEVHLDQDNKHHSAVFHS